MDDIFIDTCPTMKMAIILTQEEGKTYEEAIIDAIFQMRKRAKDSYKIYKSYNGDDHYTLFYNAELLKRNINRLIQTYYLYYTESLEQIKKISEKRHETQESDLDYINKKCIEAEQFIEVKSKLINYKKYGYILESGKAVKLSDKDIEDLKEDVGKFPLVTIKTAKTILSECEKCLKSLNEQNLPSPLKQKISSTLEIISSNQPEE